jgi:nitrate/nitrite transport system ATP-binding protein
MNNSKYLEIWNIKKVYPTPTGPAVIVEDFNLNVAEGEFVCLIGHSGCGKSTVLSMIAGLNALSGGGIILAGREITGPGPDRGMVFQSPCLLPWLSALGNVQLGVEQVLPRQSKKQWRDVAAHYLELVGLGDALHKKPHELSGGMRQRVGLARAFALSPKLLLLDEPFGMLDSLTRFELQDVLLKLWSEDRKTAVMVTHDVDEALFLSDRVVMMTSGPAATVGEIVALPFQRPRDRQTLIESAEYYPYRERLIGFLEDHATGSHAAPTPSERQSEPAALLSASSEVSATA